MTTPKHLAWVGAALGLAACGDGGGDGGPVVPDSARFTELSAEASDLYFEHQGASAESLPASGSATFEGAAAFATERDLAEAAAGLDPDEEPLPRDWAVLASPSMVSDVTLTADFGSNAVEGRVHDFEGAAGVEIDGELAITDGGIDRDRGTFQADLGGTLTVDGEDVTYANGPFVGVNGSFQGEGVEALQGSTASVATGAAGEEVVYGVFTAER